MMRNSVCLFVACATALFASPAMSQVSDYDRAVAARLADDPALAVSLLEPWLAERPDDADARLQYGYALLALGRFDEAEAAFQAASAKRCCRSRCSRRNERRRRARSSR